jgi:hypothetical protein
VVQGSWSRVQTKIVRFLFNNKKAGTLRLRHGRIFTAVERYGTRAYFAQLLKEIGHPNQLDSN